MDATCSERLAAGKLLKNSSFGFALKGRGVSRKVPLLTLE
jgi:hypothetical protein